MGLVLVYPAVLGGKVLAPEDLLMFRPPFAALRPPTLLHPSNFLLQDAVEVFHPDLEWVRGMIRAGHLPLWDPNIFAGEPLLATQQTAMFFPTTVLAYVLPFWSSLGIIIVLKIAFAAWGTWLVCRARGMRAASGWLAATSYAFGMYFVIWLDHPQTNVWLLLPWLVLAVRRTARRGDLRGVGLLGAAVGLMLLGGHPESVFIVGLFVIAFAAHELVGRDAAAEPAGRRRAVFLRLLAGTLLGAVCGLVVLAPFVEQLGQSVGAARGGSNLPSSSLLSLFLPDFWGRPDHGFSGNGPVNYAERTIYIGALPLLLAFAGLYRSRLREQWFFVAVSVAALILAIHLPGLGGLPRLPVLDDVALSRALVVVSFALAMLAAYGLEAFLDGDAAHRRRMLEIAGLIALVPVALALVHGGILGGLPRFDDLAPSLWGHSANLGQTEADAVTRWIVTAGAGLALLAALGRGRRQGLVIVALVAWCTIDLLALDHGYQPAVSQAIADPPATPSIVQARAAQGHARVAGLGQYLVANVSERYGLRDVRGHELPPNRRFLSLFNGLHGLNPLLSNRYTGILLNDFAVRIYMVGPTHSPSAPQLQFLSGGADGAIYENTTALPRAYLASTWQPVVSRVKALRATLRTPPSRLRFDPVIETKAVPATPAPVATRAATVTFRDDGADEVKLAVNSTTGGYLVLLDSYYPGWKATVDGRPASIEAANEAFRAVAVSPGAHVVDFRYRPATVFLGGPASIVGWLTVLLAILVRPRRRTPSGGRPGVRRQPEG